MSREALIEKYKKKVHSSGYFVLSNELVSYTQSISEEIAREQEQYVHDLPIYFTTTIDTNEDPKDPLSLESICSGFIQNSQQDNKIRVAALNLSGDFSISKKPGSGNHWVALVQITTPSGPQILVFNTMDSGYNKSLDSIKQRLDKHLGSSLSSPVKVSTKDWQNTPSCGVWVMDIYEKLANLYKWPGNQIESVEQIEDSIVQSITESVTSYKEGKPDYKGYIEERRREIFDSMIAQSINDETTERDIQNMLNAANGIYITSSKAKKSLLSSVFENLISISSGIANRLSNIVFSKKETDSKKLSPENQTDKLSWKEYIFSKFSSVIKIFSRNTEATQVTTTPTPAVDEKDPEISPRVTHHSASSLHTEATQLTTTPTPVAKVEETHLDRLSKSKAKAKSTSRGL